MKSIYLSLLIPSFVMASEFETNAKSLVNDLKGNLVKGLTESINKNGLEGSIQFCKENVRPIAKTAAKDRINKFEFGRSSHKIRNTDNEIRDWQKNFVDALKDTTFDENQKGKYSTTGKDINGKSYYIEALFTQSLCLNCHGDNIEKNLSDKIKALYPKDQATGFKLNEFRGIVWVKEK